MKGKDGGVDSHNESCSDDTAAGNKILTSDWNISAEAGRHSDIVEGAKNETIMLKKVDLKIVTLFKKQSEDMAENSALRGMAQGEGCMDDQSIMSKAIDFTIGHDNIPSNEANEHLIMFSKPDYGSQNKHAWMATEQSPEISLSKKEVPNKRARKATKAGSLEGEFEARLAALNEVNQLSTLTVVDLRKILRKIGMPIASRKQDLVLEVKKFLTTRKTLGLLQEQSASDDQVKDIKSFTKSQELKQAQVLEMDCGRLGMDCITNSVCQFPLVSSPEQKEDQELQRGIRRISRKKNSVICSSETPAPEQISISVPEQEQTQIIQVITENMGRAEEIVSPYPELPHQLCQLVSNTVVETHESTSDLPDGASLFEKEQKQVRFEFLTGNVVKADIGAYDYTGQVYKRRWHRNMMAQTKTERLVEKDNSHNGKEVHRTLEVCSKVSDVRCKDKVLPARKTDAKVHDQFQSVSMTTSKKRKMVKGPHTSEPEVLTVVSQEVLTVVSQESELTMNINEPWTMLVHKKIQPGWIAYNPLTMRPNPPTSGIGVMKLLSWNVNGLRALLKEKSEQRKNPILDLSERENFDVLCLQETKLQEKDVEKIKTSLPPDYEYSFWSCSLSKLGYSGTAVISRIKPLSVRYGLGIIDHDSEGRLITLEFDGFYLVAGYVPNSGQKLERLAYRTQEWDPVLSDYMKKLEKNKPVVLTGDLNCAHQEIDIFNPDGNRRSAGFTTEERISFEVNFLNKGLVDSFRRQNQDVVAYTYWGYRTGARATNRGWRLDYFLISQAIADHVHDSYTLPHVGGSDHCPIGLILRV